jgi:hypothetical protein
LSALEEYGHDEWSSTPAHCFIDIRTRSKQCPDGLGIAVNHSTNQGKFARIHFYLKRRGSDLILEGIEEKEESNLKQFATHCSFITTMVRYRHQNTTVSRSVSRSRIVQANLAKNLPQFMSAMNL